MPYPLLSIVDATVDRALRLRVGTVGLVGSNFMMRGVFFKTALRNRGMEVLTPSLADQEYIHTEYLGELVQGIVRETRDAFKAFFLRLRTPSTMLKRLCWPERNWLLHEDSQGFEMPLLDTTTIHI